MTAHEERVHGGHFGSDKGVYAVEDGGQVGKLQFLERRAEKTREEKTAEKGRNGVTERFVVKAVQV